MSDPIEQKRYVDSTRPIYVLAQDIIREYALQLPLLGRANSMHFAPDLTCGRIVIPLAVIQSLSGVDRDEENRDTGSAALNLKRVLEQRAERDNVTAAMRVLREIYATRGMQTLNDSYRLELPPGTAETPADQPIYQVLPVHADFAQDLPFRPAACDVDGQTLLAALAILCIDSGLHIDGRQSLIGEMKELKKRDDLQLELVTNNDALAVAAATLGIETVRFEEVS